MAFGSSSTTDVKIINKPISETCSHYILDMNKGHILMNGGRKGFCNTCKHCVSPTDEKAEYDFMCDFKEEK